MTPSFGKSNHPAPPRLDVRLGKVLLKVMDRQTPGSARDDLDLSPIYPSRDAKSSNAAPFTEDQRSVSEEASY